jgi:hypothetical protein
MGIWASGQCLKSGSIAGVTDIIVELDGRRRASLGRIGRAEHTRYLAHEEPDGSIVLTPAVVMSEIEASFLRNRHLVAAIEENRAHPERASVTFADLDG